MSHFQQTLVIDAEPSSVYAALATPRGISSWWTPDVQADTNVGGMIHVRFGANNKDFRITRLEENREVRWLCTRAFMSAISRHDEWVGTEMIFKLTRTADRRTRLDFEHIGLDPALECYDLCRGGWQYFLASLKQFAETGRGTPYETKCAA